MTSEERQRQLQEIAATATAAERRGDGWAANEEWRRYELVRDGGRDPDELLADGLALSRMAIDARRGGRAAWALVSGFGRLLADLNDEQIGYVVVGGIAVIRHGVIRATRDVDVIVALDSATSAGVDRLVFAWGATRPDGSPEQRRQPSLGWPLHLRTPHGLIDLMAPGDPPLDFDGLRSRADERRVDGTPAPICSLADLVAMKRLAGRPQDLDDLAKLEVAHGTLPELPAG